ncbi:hypothetical protein [Lacinutrix neustonica]|nr:hypothetical protein [Lacinutrix neustonica]
MKTEFLEFIKPIKVQLDRIKYPLNPIEKDTTNTLFNNNKLISEVH